MNVNRGCPIDLLRQDSHGREFFIREAREEDAEALLDALNNISGETDFLNFGSGEFHVTVDEERKLIRSYASTDNQLFLVVWVEDVIAGVALLTGGRRPRDYHRAELGMSLRKAVWGHGVGSQLLDVLIDWARRTAVITKIDLLVHVDNTRALRLYEKKGFTREGRLTRQLLINGTYHDQYAMGLTVDSVTR